MSPVKRKKIDKASVVNFAVNFCAVFALIYMVMLLLVADMLGGASQAGLAAVSFPLQNECSCGGDAAGDSQTQTPTTLFPVAAPESGSYLQLAVDDGGFSLKQLNVSLDGPKMIEISNKGVNTHSFVIDGLSIDSGVIEPGAAKTVVLENLPQGTRNYTYYSNTAGDDKTKFSGVIAVTE